MQHDYQISVIIPVYNVENYIAKCLDSVLQQCDETVEIICVNDDSPDGSRQIITDYISKHKNIKCIDRPNGGLSAARNTGIIAAKGEYILLLDSDDWLEKNVLPGLYIKAKENNLDVLIGNVKWIYSHKTHIEKQNAAEIVPKVTDGTDAIVKLMQAEIYVPMAYNYICKREFIIENNVYFKEGLIYEDELWTPQILLQANRVLASNKYHYNYLQRENTITNSVLSQFKVDCFFYVSQQLIKLSDINNGQELNQYLWLRACILYNRGLQMYKQLNAKGKQTVTITGYDLWKSRMNFEGINTCLPHLDYTKNQRRLLRLIFQLIRK